jgi:hypothetical protein
MARSQGPDKLKNGFACYVHHSGVRSFTEFNASVIDTGRKALMDYDCCCDPCLYVKSDFSVAGDWISEDRNPDIEHCCSCNPKVLVVKWTPDNTGDLCDIYEQKEPMAYEAYLVEGQTLNSVRYTGTIINHPVAIYLSPFAVGPTGEVTIDSSGCRWTMHVASGLLLSDGAHTDTEFINHTDTTCLNAPDFSFSGISGFGGYGGTVSVENYDSSKVAFAKRNLSVSPITGQGNLNSIVRDYIDWLHPDPKYGEIYAFEVVDPPNSGTMVRLPSGIISPPVRDSGFPDYPDGQYPTGIIPLVTDCSEVPRYLCVEFFRDYSSFSATEELIRYREYAYDTGFYPIQRMEFHPSYTGYECAYTGQALARWIYTPLNDTGDGQLPAGEQKRYLYLYETYVDEIARYSGQMDLVRDSGDPKFIFIPVDLSDSGSMENRYDHVWPGGAFYSSPTIHYLSNTGDPLFINYNEDYYYEPGNNSTRSLFLGGDKTSSTLTYGDGTSCTCETKAFGSYIQAGQYTDYRYIRPGRCSCWKYFCSDKCRCVPKKLCLLTIETIRSPVTTNINTNILQWDGDSCWTQGSGDSEIRLCLNENPQIGFVGHETYNGLCGITLSGGFFETGYAYGFDSSYPAVCNSLDMSYSFVDTIVESGISVASMRAQTYPMFADCSSRSRCETASPCYIECGSHPDAINLSFRAYSVAPADDISGPFSPTGTSAFSMTLNYAEHYNISGTDTVDFAHECYYEGYVACGTGIIRVLVSMGTGAAYPLVQFGTTTSAPFSLNPPETRDHFESYTESCNPYYFSGVINPDGGGMCPFWLRDCGLAASCGDGMGRMDMVIVEA